MNNKVQDRNMNKRIFGKPLGLQNQNNIKNNNSELNNTKRALEKHPSPNGKGKRSKVDNGDTENQENKQVQNSKASKSDGSSTIGDIPKSIELKVRSISLNNDVCVKTESPVKSRSLSVPNREGISFDNPETYYSAPKNLPKDVPDFDKSQVNDLSSEPHYANDVFDYYREKEMEVRITKYIDNQPELSKPMRAVLVDWMVEVQESFELNHETLYLAVKLVDQYLSTKQLLKNKFQLLGATCLLIAAKFDERIPPAIEDFLYICDDAYKRRDIVLMEIDVLRKLNFFIGYPISYRFLRRFARCAKLSMETLTLSRYILESSLMDYDLIDERDSKLAAAALLLALKMKQQSWNSTLAFYSQYEEEELIKLSYKLNDVISAPIKANMKTIRTKYSHRIFFEVAKIAPLPKPTL